MQGKEQQTRNIPQCPTDFAYSPINIAQSHTDRYLLQTSPTDISKIQISPTDIAQSPADISYRYFVQISLKNIAQSPTDISYRNLLYRYLLQIQCYDSMSKNSYVYQNGNSIDLFFTSTRKITHVECKQTAVQICIRYLDPWTIKEKIQIFRFEFEYCKFPI